MRFRLVLLISLFTLLSISSASDAATVGGTIYDMALEPAYDVRVTVNSSPQQSLISKDGTYSFELSIGNYMIEAVCMSRYRKCYANENLTIVDNGDYVLDLIVFPDISEEEALLEENVELGFDDFSDDYEESKANGYDTSSIVAYSLIILIIAAIFYTFYIRRKKKINKKTGKKSTTKNDKDDDITQKVIDYLRSEGGRATQKDIRKQFPFSEAKMSLVLTELEDKGSIRKIKKGKGNIVILQA